MTQLLTRPLEGIRVEQPDGGVHFGARQDPFAQGQAHHRAAFQATRAAAV